MKKLLMVCMLLIPLGHLYAQKDNLQNLKDSSLVKGFYKTYQEFLSNNPSVRRDFSTVPLRVSKEDSTIIGAEYKIADSLDNFGAIWGFCDGKDIFVANGNFFVLRYWKIQCKGPNPYFYYSKRSISIIPGIAGLMAGAITASLPPSCDLMFIDKNGRPQNTLRFNLKKLFRDNPILFKEFKNEDDDTDEIAMKYIIRYNESK